MRRSRPAPCPWPRMAISMSDPSPCNISSVSSSRFMSSCDMSWSSNCWMRGSSGPSAFLRPAPRASRSRKYRSKSRSKVGRSRDSLTSVEASADLKVSRCSRPISDDAASASMASLGAMRSPARRRSPMNSRILWSIKFWGGAPPAAPPPVPPTRPRRPCPARSKLWGGAPPAAPPQDFPTRPRGPCPARSKLWGGVPPAAPPQDFPTRPRGPCPARSKLWGGVPPAAPPQDFPTRPRGPCPARWLSSRERDPGGLEDVLPLVTGDGAQPPVFEAEEPVEGAGGDEVRHLEFPAELASGGLLVALYELRHVGHVTHEVEYAHRPFRTAESQHHLVGGILPRSLHRHLAGLEEMRHGLGHRGAEESLRPGIRVVEVPAARRIDPQLGVLAEGGGDAAAALDEHGPAGAQLRQPDARTRKPQLAELAQGHGR